ncbi:uncharacterized protein LOC123203557 isoform X2 [Mangifera indica]|uniref:uncharacterized protein LOC123203557 isoform X2 n=1 Tax=Mangifera indica TaxID=29780 RepID=UPI001CFC1D48|nr:uncharacterized protein LOC123203557 isoform X2 [Mangifera indica]
MNSHVDYGISHNTFEDRFRAVEAIFKRKMITEMDNSRDVRRGVSRFSRQQMKQSEQKLLSASAGLDGVVGDDFVSLEKSKKERLTKKLSVVNKASSTRQDSETGCKKMSSDRDRDNEFPSQSHSFKLPKKQFSDDCNGVDHASIPRKLRSAMKKRNRKSISPPLPDSKKLNHTMCGVKSPKKNGLKKSKLNLKQGSSDSTPKQGIGSITKDEKEVVETLYALAEMFSDNDNANKNNLENSPSEAKPPALPECRESPPTAFKDSAVSREGFSSICPVRTSEVVPSSNLETSLEETGKINSLGKPNVGEKSDSHACEIFPMKSDTCVPQVNLCSTMASLAKSSYNADLPLCDPAKLHVPAEISFDSRSKQSIDKDAPLLGREPRLTMGATVNKSHLVQQDRVMDSGKKGLALWPELSPILSHGSGCPGPSLQSSTAKDPAWLDAPICDSNPSSFDNGPLSGKVSKGATGRLLKRCTAHVYIACLIHNLNKPEIKQNLSLQPNQVKPPNEGEKQGVFKAINDFERVDKGANGVILTNDVPYTTSERDSCEGRGGILQHKRLYQDQQQNTEASRANTLQKQSFDFLSLSAGNVEAEANNSSNRAGKNGLEPSSRFEVSHLHSLIQHKFMPSSMSQCHYTSSVCPDQFSASTSAQQIPPYLSSSPYLGPSRTSSFPVLTKQQHQQQVWAAQLNAQYRSGGTSTAMNQFPSWLNGRQDPNLFPCPQSISSFEVVGSKYGSILQQRQPQLVAIASSLPPPPRVKRLDHHLPSVYEEIESGFCTGGALPLQLLCNERL